MRVYLGNAPTSMLAGGLTIAAVAVACLLAIIVGLWTDSTGLVLLAYFGSLFPIAVAMTLGLRKWLRL